MQRGIYPMETFSRNTAYGLPVFVSNNEELVDYLNRFVEQLKGTFETTFTLKSF